MKTTVIIRRHIRQVYSLLGNKYEYFWKIECSKDIRWVAPDGTVTDNSLAGEYRTLTAAKSACERAGVDFEYFKKKQKNTYNHDNRRISAKNCAR